MLDPGARVVLLRAMRGLRALGVALGLRRVVPFGVAGALLLSAAPPALAQSAADKATARQLATEGIKLFRGGEYADALDKLQRAEALYDAPVHLLYIARCQVKLGKLVEGAETYRKLARVELQPGAPSAFKDAKDAGGPEFSRLEPRIPSLKLEVTPANVEGMKITIDGEQVPAAVVGVDRPANPGSHDIEVSAPGYAPVKKTIQLAEKETKPVEIKLEASSAGAAAVAAPAATSSGAATKPPPASSAPPPGKSEAPLSRLKLGFMLGARVGVSVPGGSMFTDPVTGGDVSASDYARPGGGLELHGGIRFAKYFTPVLLGSFHFLRSGKQFDSSAGGIGTQSTTTVSAANGGIGIIVGTPRNQLGFFGELDFLPYEEFSAKTDVSTPIGSCSETDTLSGNALRLGAGAVIPLAGVIHLTPFVTGEFGKFTDAKVSSDCGGGSTQSKGGSIDSQYQTTHSLVFIGVGGDWVFGNDKPSK